MTQVVTHAAASLPQDLNGRDLSLQGLNAPGLPPLLVVLSKWIDAREKALSVGNWMANQAVLSAAHPAIVAAKDQAGREAGIDGRNRRAWIGAIRSWMLRHIRYTPDPATIEALDTPLRTLSRGAADCDGSALQAALYVSAGIRCQVVLWAASGQVPTHVFVEAWDPAAARFVNADWVATREQTALLSGGNRIEIPVKPLNAGMGAAVQVNAVPGEEVAGLSGLPDAPPEDIGTLEWLGQKVLGFYEWVLGDGHDINAQAAVAQSLPKGTTIVFPPGTMGGAGRLHARSLDDLAAFLRLNGAEWVLIRVAEVYMGRHPSSLAEAVRWLRLAAEDANLRPTWERVLVELQPATAVLKALAGAVQGAPVATVDEAVQIFDRSLTFFGADANPSSRATAIGFVVGGVVGAAGVLGTIYVVRKFT